ncbi:unnamed protein product [Rhodiola kirilowii]
MSNLAQAISKLKRDPGKLPSQTMPNPRGNVSALAVTGEERVDSKGKVAETERIANDVQFNIIHGQPTCKPPTAINCKGSATSSSSADAEHLHSAGDDHVIGPRMEHLKCSSPAIWSEVNMQTDPPLPFSVQVRALEEHKIEKDEL